MISIVFRQQAIQSIYLINISEDKTLFWVSSEYNCAGGVLVNKYFSDKKCLSEKKVYLCLCHLHNYHVSLIDDIFNNCL